MNNDNKRLYVGGVPFRSTNEDLVKYFSQAGEVVSANIIMEPGTRRSKGFAFVEMATEESTKKAIEMFHDQEFDGRRLMVNIAKPREERPQGERRSFQRRDDNNGGQSSGGFRARRNF